MALAAADENTFMRSFIYLSAEYKALSTKMRDERRLQSPADRAPCQVRFSVSVTWVGSANRYF